MSEIEILKNIISCYKCNPMTNYNAEICKLAEEKIESLREKQEREKGCEYCNPQIMDGNPIIHFHSDHYIGNGKFSKAGIWARYCPMCGRKLGENDG